MLVKFVSCKHVVAEMVSKSILSELYKLSFYKLHGRPIYSNEMIFSDAQMQIKAGIYFTIIDDDSNLYAGIVVLMVVSLKVSLKVSLIKN